ncbi:hypothetical protein MMC19_003543 [Ptychographa xylographoides]|nr:hypothetical protein [Ptychographa xylographoides]
MMHPATHFDDENRKQKCGNRACIGMSGYAVIHPSLRMRYHDFTAIVKNLKALDPDIDANEAIMDNERHPFTEQDLEDLREIDIEERGRFHDFWDATTTIQDVLAIGDIAGDIGIELDWRGGISLDVGDHSIADLRRLQAFATVKDCSGLSDLRNGHGPYSMDRITTWISPLKFFRNANGALRTGLIWFINLEVLDLATNFGVIGSDIITELETKNLAFSLCPHIKLTHNSILEFILSICECLRTRRDSPTNPYIRCSQCSTLIKLRVERPRWAMIPKQRGFNQLRVKGFRLAVAVVRDSGHGKSAQDPSWIAQLKREEDQCANAMEELATYQGSLQMPPGEMEI